MGHAMLGRMPPSEIKNYKKLLERERWHAEFAKDRGKAFVASFFGSFPSSQEVGKICSFPQPLLFECEDIKVVWSFDSALSFVHEASRSAGLEVMISGHAGQWTEMVFSWRHREKIKNAFLLADRSIGAVQAKRSWWDTFANGVSTNLTADQASNLRQQLRALFGG